MDYNNKEIHHQIGIIYTPLVHDVDYIDMDDMSEMIQDIDYNSLINEKVNEMRNLSLNGSVSEKEVVLTLENMLKEEVEFFNQCSREEEDEPYYLWYEGYKRVFIDGVIDRAHYNVDKRFDYEESIEAMINEIAHQFPEGTSLVIIIFEIFVTIKGVPLFIYYPN